MQTILTASFLFDDTGIGTMVFFPLLQEGFNVKAQIDSSVTNLLCEQFGLSPTYIEERIKTAFLDGKPVDDFKTTIIGDGSALALSAAMPGLVGATFRKGGVLASLRGTITYQSSDFDTERRQGFVSIKLFNFLAGEIGAAFLTKGIFISMPAAKRFFSQQRAAFLEVCKEARLDGQKVHVEQLPEIIGPHREGSVCIRLDS